MGSGRTVAKGAHYYSGNALTGTTLKKNDMTENDQVNEPMACFAEQLFQFAIDRGDMNVILEALPIEAPEKRTAVAYEIQLLRIISVGWGISFFLENDTLKNQLGQQYWEQVRAFSTTLSTSASLTVGSAINYFEIIKKRLDTYVEALDAAGKIPDPAVVIGPVFADVCGDKEDALAVLAGSKMFSHTILAVRQYLDETVLQQDANAALC